MKMIKMIKIKNRMILKNLIKNLFIIHYNKMKFHDNSLLKQSNVIRTISVIIILNKFLK